MHASLTFFILSNLATSVYVRRQDVLYFSDFLEIFDQCSITYHHLWNHLKQMETKFEEEPPNQSEILAKLRREFGRKVLLQFFITTNSTLSERTVDSGRNYQAFNVYRISWCSVMLLPQKQVKLYSELTMYTRSYSVIHSEFTWFIKDIPGNPFQLENSYIELVNSQKPGIYLEIENFSLVSMICIPCSEKRTDSNLVTLSRPKMFGKPSVSHVRKAWEDLHLNLKGSLIKTYVPNVSLHFHKGQLLPCSPYPHKTSEYRPLRCVLILLSLKLNFSLEADNSNLNAIMYSDIHVLFVADITLKLMKDFGKSAIPYGTVNQWYHFIVLYHKMEMRLNLIKLQGILAPFPWWTWICIAALAISTSHLLIANAKQGAIFSFLNTFHSCFMYTVLLVDQGAPSLPKSDVFRNFKLWLVWGIFTLIISNAYRGFLFSSLTANVEPAFPGTVEQLVTSGMLVGTSEKYQNYVTKETGSTLKDLILQSLIMFWCASNVTRKVYTNLQESVQWFQVPLDSTSNFSIRASINRSILAGPNSSIITAPKKFTILDDNFVVDKFKNLFEEIDTYWVSRPVTETSLGMNVILATHNNFLYQTISVSIAKMHESGLKDWWDNWYNEYTRRSNKQQVQHYMRQLQSNRHTSDVKYEVPKAVFLQILIYYTAFNAVCLVAFVFECFCKILARIFFS